ncbi:hypothetical protein PspLS_04007 [Pyricularia sp. CBS 133598]|nr:hypothetical protein PspLS_04007 [Pyricularia sp. CBS 133598]
MKFSAIFAIVTLASAAAAMTRAESSTHQDANHIIIRDDGKEGYDEEDPGLYEKKRLAACSEMGYKMTQTYNA